jgi:hypothetical protein
MRGERREDQEKERQSRRKSIESHRRISLIVA